MADKSLMDDDTEAKKPQKEIVVVQDQGIFKHDTGDVYDGFFEAKKKDRSVKMHGPGTYTTAEGDIYSGVWEADRLVGSQQVEVKYVDGSRFEGFINKDWCYSGQAMYFYPDESILSCDFADNVPVGYLTLTDPNGHTWRGKAESGFGWVEPVNHFYEFLVKNRESGKVKRRNTRVNGQDVSKGQLADSKTLH